jgi:hypothetical protein
MTAFLVTASQCVFQGFDVVGVQVTIQTNHHVGGLVWFNNTAGRAFVSLPTPSRPTCRSGSISSVCRK